MTWESVYGNLTVQSQDHAVDMEGLLSEVEKWAPTDMRDFSRAVIRGLLAIRAELAAANAIAHRQLEMDEADWDVDFEEDEEVEN